MMIEGFNTQGLMGKAELRRLTAEELSEGEWVAGKLGYDGYYPFNVGRIHKEDGTTFICQDVLAGWSDDGTYGFLHRWSISRDCADLYTELYRIPAPEPQMMVCEYTGTCIINCHAKDRQPHKERDGCHIGSGYCDGCIPVKAKAEIKVEKPEIIRVSLCESMNDMVKVDGK